MRDVLVVAPLVLDDVTTPRGAVSGELGGGATYAALAGRHFAPISVAAIIGADFPEAYLSRLARVDLSRVERVAGRSFRWIAEHRADGTTLTRRNDPGATGGRLPDLGDLSSSYVFIGAIEPLLQERIGPARFIAIDTMPGYIEADAPRLRRALAGADLALLTAEEAERLTGSRHAPDVRRHLGVKMLVVKVGAEGAYICHELAAAGVLHVPAYPAASLDPTGAGDAFAGAFVATLAARDGLDLETLQLAGRRGAAAASVAVEDFGPRALERASGAELERRAAQLAKVEALA